MQRSHLVIINEHSFFKNKAKMLSVINEFERTFKSFSIDKYEIKISTKPRNALRLIRTRVDNLPGDHIVRVYAVGGDGILFDCLNGIVGLPNIELAAVPYGSTNDFVRGFGEANMNSFRSIPEQIFAGTIPLDVINCGSSYALNFCSIGMETVYYRATQALLKKAGVFKKVLVPLCNLAVAGFIFVLLRSNINKQFYEIEIDEKIFCNKFSAIHIANGPKYGGTLSVVSTAKTADGLLDVVIGGSFSSIQSIFQMNDFLHSRYFKHSCFQAFSAKKIKVNSESPLYIMLDGEMFTDTFAEIKIIPGAVNFVDVKSFVSIQQMNTGTLYHDS